MADEKNKWIEATAKMIELTQNGKIKWVAEKPFRTLNTDESAIVGTVFHTTYKDKRIRIYERQFIDIRDARSLEPESYLNLNMRNLFFSPKKEKFINSEVVMEFVDEYHNKIWSFPSVSTLIDLLSAVRFQVSGAKDFIDDITSDDSK